MTEKNSGRIMEQIPYRIYEFSDITLPYTFQNATDYTITLQRVQRVTKIIKPLLSLQVFTLPWQMLAAFTLGATDSSPEIQISQRL
jgi:hypothetical protein